MFAKKEKIKMIDRLKKRSDFLCVQQKGRKWVSKGMIVEICENETSSIRYGLTVSKRVSKLAVLRNRTKRRLKTVALDVLPDYKDHNLDIVLVGRLSTAGRSSSELHNDLVWCLKKMGVTKTGKEEN